MTTAFTLRLSEATLQALDQLAEKTERSRSWLAVKAIEHYVALNAWQIAKIEAGIAAADHGDFAEADDVARLGFVGIHREFITAATRWIMAAKL